MSNPTNAASADGEPTYAFAISNFRRFFVGQSLSNIGTWFQLLAQALLVLKLTGRASSLGETFAIQTLPMLVLGPFVGPFLDRANLRKVLIVISAVAGAEAFALAALYETHHITIYWIFGLSFLLGFAQMYNQPGIQTIISELVPQSVLPSAVSLSAIQTSVGRLAGPAAAGLLYAWRGAGFCFIVNGISYLVVLAAVLSLRRDKMYPRPPRQRSARQFVEGLQFVWRSPIHRGQLLASFVIGCLAFNFPLYYSSFTHFVLHSGAASFGIAESINAGFAVLGGIILSRKLRNPNRRSYITGCFLLGGSLVLTCLATNVTIFYLDMVVFGLCVVTYNTMNQTILQMNTPRDRIGSVMTLLSYSSQGTTPIGALIVGWVVTIASARVAIGLGGFAAIGSGLVLGINELRQRNRSEIARDVADHQTSKATI